MGALLLRGLYFLVVTPIAIVLRLSGWDGLRLRKRDTRSYWIPRG